MEIVDILKGLGVGVDWLVAIVVIRYLVIEIIGKIKSKTANGSGLRRRITDSQPGNPGHSHYEVLTDRVEGVDHRLEALANRVDSIGERVARIEGKIG